MGKINELTIIEKIVYILTEYNKGNYTTTDFCDLFELYYRDLDLSNLSDCAEKWLQDLDELCGRFSEYPQDFEISNAFVDEKTIKTHTENFLPDMFRGKM